MTDEAEIYLKAVERLTVNMVIAKSFKSYAKQLSGLSKDICILHVLCISK